MKQGDYKEWMQERADDLAMSIYGAEYYDLPNQIQLELYAMAESDYKDHYASMIDVARDAAKDNQLLR